MAERQIRPLRPQPRIIPSGADLHEPAGQDPSTAEDQEGLAQIAYLADINPSNTAVAAYVNSLNNTAYANTLNGVTAR